jgi:hypothetical protein
MLRTTNATGRIRDESLMNLGGRGHIIYSVETTYGINSVISKLMTIVENAETGQFLFMIMLILSSFTCS